MQAMIPEDATREIYSFVMMMKLAGYKADKITKKGFSLKLIRKIKVRRL
jgi:hypothetical protein